MEIRIALPKGRLLRRTAAILEKAGWEIDEYHSRMGFYRPESRRFPELKLRVFHEKDIPIQIAMGNYDLGICCLDWIEELVSKYPSSELFKVKDLFYEVGALYMVEPMVKSKLRRNGALVRIASEYPNLAESFALKRRLSRFSILPVWGAAEAYPPENADMALISVKNEADLAICGMVPIGKVLDYSAFLVANRQSWESKDLDSVMTTIFQALPATGEKEHRKKAAALTPPRVLPGAKTYRDTVRLALPDGHQQQPTISMLNRAGIQVKDYPSETGNRRPAVGLEGVTAKVIRPQDMPLQVANGNFDLAITGRDWLTEHLCQFPSSPVKELVDLKFGTVRLVAVVSQELPIDNALDLRKMNAVGNRPFRVASEYVNLADKYARDNHIGHYRVIPTWGATEAFLPEDADLLIENTETGRTIARHKLKIIDTMFISTACLIGNTRTKVDSNKGRIIISIIEKLCGAVKDVS